MQVFIFLFFTESFGKHTDFTPVLEELRAVHHVFKSCRTNHMSIMTNIFKPHLSRKRPFLDLSLPFDLKMKDNNFCLGFLPEHPTSPIVLVRPETEKPQGRKVIKLRHFLTLYF